MKFKFGPMIFCQSYAPLTSKRKKKSSVQTNVKLKIAFEIFAACLGIGGVATHLA